MQAVKAVGKKLKQELIRDEAYEPLEFPKIFQVLQYDPKRPKAYLGVRPFYRYISPVDGSFFHRRYVTGIVYDDKEADKIKAYQPDAIGIRRGQLVVDVLTPGLYEFLRDHPENQSNPHRPHEVAATFKMLDPDADRLLQLETDKKMNAAFMKVNEVYAHAESDKMVEDLCVHLGINYKQQEELVRADLYTAARLQPDVVMEFQGVDWAKIKDLFEKALQKKILVYRQKMYGYAWSKQVQPLASKQFITGFDRSNGSAKQQFVEYLGSHRGQLVLAELDKRVDLASMNANESFQGNINPIVKEVLKEINAKERKEREKEIDAAVEQEKKEAVKERVRQKMAANTGMPDLPKN